MNSQNTYDNIEYQKWYNELLQLPELENPILKSLYDFYLVDNNIEKILPILTSNSNISIRVLDWFVTNYSKKYNIIYQINNDNSSLFNVYLQYKSQLKGYRKKLFDPFCRKKRIFFYYDIKKCIVTTIFRWAIKYNILEYVSNNLQDICVDMNKSTKIYIENLKKSEKNSSSEENDIYLSESTNNSPTSDSIEFTENSETSDDTIILSNILTSKINNIYKNDKKINKISKDKKRHELSENKNLMVNKINLDITLDFE
jgi:hypothetical protein